MRKQSKENQAVAEQLREAPGITAAQLQKADPEILTLDEAAAMLRRSAYQTRVYIHEGKIPGYQLRPGGKMLLCRRDLDKAFQPSPNAPAYLNASEAAELLRVSRKTLYEATEERGLQRDPVNNLYRRQDLLGLLLPFTPSAAGTIAESKAPYDVTLDPKDADQAEQLDADLASAAGSERPGAVDDLLIDDTTGEPVAEEQRL